MLVAFLEPQEKICLARLQGMRRRVSSGVFMPVVGLGFRAIIDAMLMEVRSGMNGYFSPRSAVPRRLFSKAPRGVPSLKFELL